MSTYHLKIAKPAPLVRLEQNRLCKLGVKVAQTPKKSFHSSKCLFRVSHTNNFYVILTCWWLGRNCPLSSHYHRRMRPKFKLKDLDVIWTSETNCFHTRSPPHPLLLSSLNCGIYERDCSAAFSDSIQPWSKTLRCRDGSRDWQKSISAKVKTLKQLKAGQRPLTI